MTAGGPRRPVLAVSGLATESRIAAAATGVRTVAGGGDARRLAAAIEQHLADGARAVISFGVAGALAPGLRPGSLIAARFVAAPGGERFEVDVAWARSLLEAIPGATSAGIAGSDSVVANRAQKEALGRSTGAVAVDMESHVAARIAAAHGLPFAALRAIADPAARTVPSAATAAMVPGGAVAAHKALLVLLRHPSQLPGLVRLALDARCALRALARGRRLLGDRLGCVDLDELAPHVV